MEGILLSNGIGWDFMLRLQCVMLSNLEFKFDFMLKNILIMFVC